MALRTIFRIITAHAVLLSTGAESAEPDAVSEASVSPDERFVIERVVVWANADEGQATEDSPYFRIVERESKRTVARLPAQGQAVGSDDAKFLWAPDSKRFAWNYRGRGREETTELFQYDAAAKGGGAFIKLEQPAGRLSRTVIAPEHARQLKALKLPPKSELRDIWDSWQVVNWSDAATAEMRIHSIRHVQNIKAQEVPVLGALFQVTLRFDAKGKWKVMKAELLANDADAQAVPDGE